MWGLEMIRKCVGLRISGGVVAVLRVPLWWRILRCILKSNKLDLVHFFKFNKNHIAMIISNLKNRIK